MTSHWKEDFISGFIVFLIALPLSLGIAMASGFPPIAGIFAAIIGGMVVSQLSGSYVTINGPAAGLIVIVLGGVETLGKGDPVLGYTTVIAAIVCAGAILTILGILKAGTLGDLFPLSAVHGMLTAIGLIIISKQMHTVFGVTPAAKAPFALFAELPHTLMNVNPEITIIGLLSLAIMILLPKAKSKWVKRIPAPIVVVLLGVFLGYLFDLEHEHVYLFPANHENFIGPKFLVTLPSNILGGITHPNWSLVSTTEFWVVVITLSMVQGLKTLLSASAVDKLDPYKRKSNLSRDLAAVGVGTMISGAIGGLPMIAEIVRSSANITNGAKTKWANFFHGLIMLAFVALIPNLIHHIPVACLAAILCVTGYRLASPSQFAHAFEIGREQLLIFITTVVVTLATDLIVGVGSGIVLKMLLHWLRGASMKDLFKPRFEVVSETSDQFEVKIRGSLVFTNYLALSKLLRGVEKGKKRVIDLTDAFLIDHTVMEKLHDMQADLKRDGMTLELKGLDDMVAEAHHPLSARRRFKAS